MFYFQPNEKNAKNASRKDFIYFDSPLDDIVHMQGVSMNEKYIFFWNMGSIWKLDLDTKIVTKLGLYVSEKET